MSVLMTMTCWRCAGRAAVVTPEEAAGTPPWEWVCLSCQSLPPLEITAQETIRRTKALAEAGTSPA